MKITAKQLRSIIKEETRRILQEAPDEASLEKLDDEIRQHLIAAERLVAFNSEKFQNAMSAYADAWLNFFKEHPEDREAGERADMAKDTAKNLIMMYKKLAAEASSPGGILSKLNALRADVDAYRSELERGSGRNQ